MGVLTGSEISAAVKRRDLWIHPFRPDHVQAASYDLTLGPWYYRQQRPRSGSLGFINPHSPEAAREVWGKPFTADRARELIARYPTVTWAGIHPDDRVIFAEPRVPMLLHTYEFVGSARYALALANRSSQKRHSTRMFDDAYWIGVGFFNRPTLEPVVDGFYRRPLVVATRVCTLIVYELVGAVDLGGLDSKYSAPLVRSPSPEELEEIVSSWTADRMLPRADQDLEFLSTGPKYRTIFSPEDIALLEAGLAMVHPESIMDHATTTLPLRSPIGFHERLRSRGFAGGRGKSVQIRVPMSLVAEFGPDRDRLYLVQIRGDEMIGAIADGSFVLARTQADAEHGQIVQATLNGKPLVRKLLRHKRSRVLRAANSAYSDIVVGRTDRLDVHAVLLVVKSGDTWIRL